MEMEVSGGCQEDMGFTEWSDKLDAGNSHWLPAYGLQQPSQLHEALLHQDYEAGPHSYLYLETIIEETSDDLRSDSEYSGSGWPDTDSEAGSVIHLPQTIGTAANMEWSGSERDLAVPKKRARRGVYNTDPGVHDDDEDDDDYLAPLSSRSSSLLQFETLEKQCETTLFRTTASQEPFHSHSPSLHSSFSFDSLETSRWRFSGSPDSLEGGASSLSSSCSSSSELISSEDERLARSYSSRSGQESYRSSLKSHRSFDSLVACQEKSPTISGEFSQSLNNTVIVVEEEEPIAPPRGLYKTVECLNEAGKPVNKPQEQKKNTQRSAENLSEDSGFGEHIPKGTLRRANSSGVFTIVEQETGPEAKIDKEEWGETESNYSHWQSAPNLLDQSGAGRDTVSTTSLVFHTHEEETLPENKALTMNTVSTPNLYGEELEDGEYELRIARTHSLKDALPEAGQLRKSKSRGSNIQITTSFINLDTSCTSLPGKVHFSPVVSEVSWRDDSVDEAEVEMEEPKEVYVEPKKEEVRRPEKKVELKVNDSGGGRGQWERVGGPVVQQRPMELHQPSWPAMEATQKKNRIGGFFQRFSLRRLSGREKKKKDKKSVTVQQPSVLPQKKEEVEEVRIIPLHGPEEPPAARPPLPPGRRREAATLPQPLSVMPTGVRQGLLETDLDSGEETCRGKARSLLNLGGRPAPGRTAHPPEDTVDHRAKSMEFLLDKQAQFSVKPPENELQKAGGGERVMSEHELRVQRSLQRLNLPDWFRNSQIPSQGFLLKRHSESSAAGGGGSGIGTTPGGWQAVLSSKTTSLSSLGSRSPTGNLLSSPSPTPSGHTFSRWSTTRLASNPGSSSTSPSGSARSSFNYRQPYLGWRSQERLAHPRTPAERLAAGLLPQHKQTTPPPVANLSEVHSSIKEVTSAIVHYVSGANKEDRLSPNPPRPLDSSSSRSASPRGSTGRLCWLESSFVGNRPMEPPPETPVSLSNTPVHRGSGSGIGGGGDLYLELATSTASPHHHHQATVNGVAGREPTMDDVLDSLLGLASRSPSPAHSGSANILCPPEQFANGTERRLSEDCESTAPGTQPPLFVRPGRRVSFDMALAEGESVRCRYNKCNKTAPLAQARKTYKTCHNCTHVYCSRECRRAHWEKHRKTCLHSRVGALCRKVMSGVREEEETLHHLSVVARRGFLERGRGAVKLFFSCTENAEAFLNEGLNRLGDPSFVKWSDLQVEEVGKEMHEELTRLCQSYNPDTRFVLYVCVCVVSEVPTSGPVQWERELVSRCGKLKLSKVLEQRASSDRTSEQPDTLILTSLSPEPGSKKARQVSFSNIQRHLRSRGVSLRRHCPEVYQRLCSYVEGSLERFPPTTIYPRDAATGRTFMCVIMPDTQPHKLDLLPPDSSSVHTIDISISPHPDTAL